MTKSETPKGPLRYRLFYGLMNVALVYLIFAHALITVFGVMPTDLQSATSFVIRGMLVIFQLVVVPLLIILPWWRDEYADMLWKRTMVQLAFLMTIVPPLLMFAVQFVSTVFIQGDLDNWGGNRPDWLLDPLLGETWALKTAWDIWLIFTSAFVFLFQFNRWRDSRAAGE